MFYLKVIQEFLVNKNKLISIKEYRRPNLLSFQVYNKILDIQFCSLLFITKEGICDNCGIRGNFSGNKN